ncbi:MAG TPA: sugar ABC transporter permease, partial [Pseudorhizobium sp.]|nr:sugar ABC transporter permease [Pseudorhizobium sp.]
MTTIEPAPIVTPERPRPSFTQRLGTLLPKIVLAPSFAITLIFVYGFILWTVYLSFTRSRILPIYDLVGLDAYYRLWSQPNWYMAIKNLAIFGVLYISLCTAIGLFIAILMDQRIRAEGLLRPIFLYPMA